MGRKLTYSFYTLKEISMKKLMTLMLGLSLIIGATSLFGDEAGKDTSKSTAKGKKGKKGKKSTTS